jgi:uncharacterized protein YidB (DUF937 family)
MMMPMGIEQLFRSAAGADWASQGGLSASEFLAALKDKAGADLAFAKGELKELGKHLGLSGHDSKAIFDFLENNGKVPVDALRDQLLNSAGADKAFNLAEFKGGIDKLLDRATQGCGHDNDKGANFRRDAGADKAIDKDEFEALAKKAGITDQEVIDKAFEKLAGADGKISKDEFKDGLGDTKLSKDELAKKINDLGGAEKKDINFGKAAGADKEIGEDEFKALAKKAGITDEEQIKQVFDQVAGADGKISKDEFKAAFGDTKLSKDDFKSKFEELAKGASEPDDKQCGCDESSESGETSGSAPSNSCGPEEPEPQPGCDKPNEVWSHEVKDGQATIRLGDDYTVTVKEDGSSIKVKNNKTGAENEIWGDPHFRGGANFDFKKDLTLQLDNGAKLTVGTVDAGNGTTLASSLTITQGDNSIQVTGIGGDRDGANNLKVVQSNAGETVDDLTWDGAITLVENGAGWLTEQGDAVTQAVINEAEADAA